MSIIKPVETITASDLQTLVDDREAEKQTIDYKETLKLDIPQNKEEFRRDVCSFANASGGDLILGIREEQGFPIEVCGMQIDNPDNFKLRLEGLLQTNIHPRIPGVSIRPILLQSGMYVVIIRIPQSFIKPHQVTINNDDFQFWARNSAGKYRMNVDQLRTSFLGSETLGERIRGFRAERLGNIISGVTPVALEAGPKLVLHLVPIMAFTSPVSHDLSRMDRGDLRRSAPLSERRNYSRYNFDGYLTGVSPSPAAPAYLQIFRNGVLEDVEIDDLSKKEEQWLFLTTVEKILVRGLPRLLNLQKELGVQSPVLLLLSLLNVAGYTIFAPGRFMGMDIHKIEKDVLILPDMVLESFEIDPAQLLRPLFDSLWNAGGHKASPHYDKDGSWKEASWAAMQ